MSPNESKPKYELNMYVHPSCGVLLIPPYESMDVKLWRRALDEELRLRPGKNVKPVMILNRYKKLKNQAR